MIQYLFDRYVAPVLNDKDGVSSLEYAVLAVGIVLVVAVAATTLGGKVSTIFGTIGSSL